MKYPKKLSTYASFNHLPYRPWAGRTAYCDFLARFGGMPAPVVVHYVLKYFVQDPIPNYAHYRRSVSGIRPRRLSDMISKWPAVTNLSNGSFFRRDTDTGMCSSLVGDPFYLPHVNAFSVANFAPDTVGRL